MASNPYALSLSNASREFVPAGFGTNLGLAGLGFASPGAMAGLFPWSGYQAGFPFGFQPPDSPARMGAGMAEPRVEINETNSDVVLAVELPNVSLNNINLTVTEDALSISGATLTGGHVHRTVPLPTTVKADQVNATYANGVLEVHLPKSEAVGKKRIRVNPPPV
jgi:HSP20 family molecular chaperone IbpA